MAKLAFLMCTVACMVGCALSQPSRAGAQGPAQEQDQARIAQEALEDKAYKKPPYHDDCCCYYTCPAGWTRFQYRCYKFFGAKSTQAEAERVCQGFVFEDWVTGYSLAQGHLTSINSQDEQDFVYNLWQYSLLWPHTLDSNAINVNSANALWIGAAKVKDTWTWTDGSYWGFNGWDTPGQPSGDGPCAHMWTHSDVIPTGSWNDYQCSNDRARIPFVCEMPTIRRCE